MLRCEDLINFSVKAVTRNLVLQAKLRVPPAPAHSHINHERFTFRGSSLSSRGDRWRNYATVTAAAPEAAEAAAAYLPRVCFRSFFAEAAASFTGAVAAAAPLILVASVPCVPVLSVRRRPPPPALARSLSLSPRFSSMSSVD